MSQVRNLSRPLENQGRKPLRVSDRGDSYRTRDWIGDMRTPVMIAHGDADTVIPFAQGERLFALANEPKQFVRMEGSARNARARPNLPAHLGVPRRASEGVTMVKK